MEGDYETLSQLVNDLSNLLPTVNFSLVSGEGDITYNFLDRSSFISSEECNDEKLFYSSAGTHIGNEASSSDFCFKIGDHYKEGFTTTNEQTIKECRIYHLRASFLWALTNSWRDADREEYPNSYFASMYCNNYQKISDLDRQVLLIHYSKYVENAATVDEVYNLLK